MTQHRECCCDEQTEIECIHYDKVFPSVVDEVINGKKLYSWRTPGWKGAVPVIQGVKLGDSLSDTGQGTGYLRRNHPQMNTTGPGSNLTNEWATTGMNCMMCNHSLIMSFKRNSYQHGGYMQKLCGVGGMAKGCCDGENSCNASFHYDYSSVKMPTEQTMSALYVHWKDYWYLDRGPVGVPFSWFDEGAPLYACPGADGLDKGWCKLTGSQSNQRMGVRNVLNPDCESIYAVPLDANYMCYPELKITTNPMNPYFDRRDGTDINGHVADAPTEYLRDAFLNDYRAERYSPELSTPGRFVCSGLESNKTYPDNNIDGDCGGKNMAGFSSWQTYMMSRNPQLRSLSDTISYGDGSPMFPTIHTDEDPGDGTKWTNLYSSMVGTLHRVRLWVRADRLYLTTGNDENPILFPCTTGFGSYDPNDPTPRGPCCINGSGCFDNMTQEGCEAGYGGQWRANDWCEIPQNEGGGQGTECCNSYTPSCGEGAWTCKDWTNENNPQESCGIGFCSCDSSDPSETYPSNCTCDSDGGPSPDGRVVAFHPPLVNKKMLHLRNDQGGYTPCQKQRGGPWGMLYFCSGTPVFTSDLLNLKDEGVISEQQIQDLSEWVQGEHDSPNGPAEFECETIGQIAEKLGDSGKFNTKDWRPDQLEKYDTLESEFRRIATENEQTPIPPGGIPTGPSGLYKSIDVPNSIREYVKNTDPNDGGDHQLLPVQKTGEAFLHAFINLQVGKEKAPGATTLATGTSTQEGPATRKPSQTQYQLTEMGDYQLCSGSNNIYDISKYDPWQPANNGEWPPIGTERQERFPITMTPHPNGVDESFEFRYPIPEVYEAVYGEDFDPDTLPEWEKDMFKAWYENIPIYFHGTPGGWAWSGTGWGATPRNWGTCNWAGIGGAYNLNHVESIYQLDLNTHTCKASTALNTAACCWGDNCNDCNVPPTDPFPNNARIEAASAGTPEAGGLIYIDLQPRDQPPRKNCRTVSNICAGMNTGLSREAHCGGDDGCCVTETLACRAYADRDGAWPCNPECTNDPECCVGVGLGGNGTAIVNACTAFDPYGLGVIGFTSYIDVLDPKIITKDSIPSEIESWNRKHPNGKIGYPHCAGRKCSEQGGCGNGCECCCPDGCDENCYCIGAGEPCDTSPCASLQKWESPCCTAYGACCYEDEDGKLRCKDNVPQEECLAATNTGGLNGVFNETALCADFPCRTNLMTKGACCYEDQELSKEIICRQTTESGCDTLGGTWTDGGDCATTACTPLLALGGESCCPDGEVCCWTGLDHQCKTECNGPGETPADDNECCAPEVDCVNCTRGSAQGIIKACCCSGTCTDICSFSECQQCDTGNGCTIVDTTCEHVSSCEPGACCEGTSCSPSLPHQCTGVWYPGQICTEVNCDAGGGGGDGCACCLGVLDACLSGGREFGHLATRWAPVDDAQDIEMMCRVQKHDVVKTCIQRHYQASKNSFRIVSYLTGQDGDYSGTCPLASSMASCGYRSDSAGYCCCRACSSALHPHDGGCSGYPGGPISLEHPPHQRKGEYVVNIYPYTLRCSQIRDINGFQKCGLLESEIPISAEEFIETLPRVLLGMVDPISCGTNRMSSDCECADPKENCIVENCINCNETPQSCPGPTDGGCVTPTGTAGDTCRTFYKAECSTVYTDWVPIGNPDAINKGGYCIDLSLRSLFRARSFDKNQGADTPVPIYTPPEGVWNIPAFTCPSAGAKNMTELDRPVELPSGTLRDCASYWHDKELSSVDFTFTEPVKDTEIDFTDFSQGVTAPCGISHEFVDNDMGHPKWNTFWMKQDYPDLLKLRLFSAGCWDVDGGFEGGRGISGGFAGTMVAIFGSTTGYAEFDESIGHRNIKLKFAGAPEGNQGIGGAEFVGRPSRNPYWVEEDDDEDEMGWIGGRGLTYANVSTGTGEMVGKVYEFCSNPPEGAPGDADLKPWNCDLPFSGVRGPIALFSDDTLHVSIYQFPDRSGITDGGFRCCDSTCSSCFCNSPCVGDFGGDDPDCELNECAGPGWSGPAI